MSKDPADWHSLSEAQRATLSSCLAYLLTADSLLLENLALRFLVDVEQPEVGTHLHKSWRLGASHKYCKSGRLAVVNWFAHKLCWRLPVAPKCNMRWCAPACCLLAMALRVLLLTAHWPPLP